MRVLIRSQVRKNRINGETVARFAELVMRRCGCLEGSELSVFFVGSAAMRHLNRKYRGEDRDTDVLAFPLEEGGGMLGDVVVSVERARRQARKWGTTLNREILLYLVHGILHLRGCDDMTVEGRKKMERRQDELLRSILKKGRWNVIS